MAGALMRGLKDKARLTVYDIDGDKARALAAACGAEAADSAAALADAGAVVLCVKPQVLESALAPMTGALRRKRPLVISIAAGKTVSAVERAAGQGIAVVRAMPNVAAKVGQSVTALCGNAAVTPEMRREAREIFEAVGTVVELAEEQFGAFSALASCSPAFTLMYMDALALAGVRAGLPKQAALSIVAQAVVGTARLLQESGEHPRALMDSVCSPAGTTVEGVLSLQKNGFESAVAGAVRASLSRDRELGETEKNR